MKRFVVPTILLYSFLAGSVVQARSKEDLGIGTWSFVPAASTYESAPPPRESRRQWVKVGEEHVRFLHDGVTADGKPFHTEFLAAYDDQAVPFVGGTLYDSVALRMVSTNKVEQVFRLKGQITVRATRTISSDGKTMTIDSRGTNKNGKKFRNLLVYRRY